MFKVPSEVIFGCAAVSRVPVIFVDVTFVPVIFVAMILVPTMSFDAVTSVNVGLAIVERVFEENCRFVPIESASNTPDEFVDIIEFGSDGRANEITDIAPLMLIMRFFVSATKRFDPPYG